jgi:hypothetical protein
MFPDLMELTISIRNVLIFKYFIILCRANQSESFTLDLILAILKPQYNL